MSNVRQALKKEIARPKTTTAKLESRLLSLNLRWRIAQKESDGAERGD
jgi:hypothetical protein